LKSSRKIRGLKSQTINKGGIGLRRKSEMGERQRMNIPISRDEARWQAEDDAHSLARAEEIKEDTVRLKAAQDAARRLVGEQQERAKALGKVAGKKPGEGQKGRPAPVVSGNVPRKFV
jgi:hypothetical protein